MSNVSVIIPTFNRAEFLLKAVQSVLHQTYPVSEIIICDDGSSDNSKELVLALNSSKIIWLDCGKNGRPAIPRNKGIAKSTGEWLAFLDDDDEWLPTKIEKQIALAEQEKVKAICCNAFKSIDGVIENNSYSLNTKERIKLGDLLKSNYVICSSTLIHRTIIDKTEGFPVDESLKALEDYALWLRVSTLSDFAFVNESLVIYRDAPEQSIRGIGHDAQQQRKVIFKNLLSWVKRSNSVSKESKALIVQELKITRRTIVESFIRKQIRRFK